MLKQQEEGAQMGMEVKEVLVMSAEPSGPDSEGL